MLSAARNGYSGRWAESRIATLEAIATGGGEEDCIVWPFRRSRDGYGVIEIGGRKFTAARIVCIRAHGEPPTPIHQAAHSCGNGHLGCVNPRHLRWATPAENTIDKYYHGYKGSKLSPQDAVDIRALAGEKTHREIANLYGVHKGHISKIISGARWAGS